MSADVAALLADLDPETWRGEWSWAHRRNGDLYQPAEIHALREWNVELVRAAASIVDTSEPAH